MEPITLAEFKRVKWVQSVEAVGNGYKIKTKKKSLKTLLTHTIKDAGQGYGSAYDGKYKVGTKLAEPYSLILPQYYIHLTPDGFDFTFAKNPGVKAQSQIGFTPTYQIIYPKDGWMHRKGVCYGYSEAQHDRRSLIDEYRVATSWKERLIIAAVYLQSAEPHYGLTWYRTSYAVRLGLVGDEFIEKSVVAAPVAVQQPAPEAPQTGVQTAIQAQQQLQQQVHLANQQNTAPMNPGPIRWGGRTYG